MQFAVKTGAPAEQRTACAILPLFEGGSPVGATKAFDRALKGRLRRMQQAGDALAKLGETVMIHAPGEVAADRLLLVGCGPREEFGAKQLVAAALAAAKALQRSGAKNAISYLSFETAPGVDPYYTARLTVEAARTALYQFNELKSQDAPKLHLTRLGIGVADRADAADARRGVNEGIAIADGADLARDLGNRPPNLCTPTHMAEAAQQLAKSYENMEVKVLDKRDIARLGMGAFLSVTQGATEPPKLIVINYKGGAKKARPIALCGKGITFDTGGISLKPPAKMDEMKFDMCGGAGVIGTMKTLGELQPEINVVAIVPACENMPSGNATRPGDIVTSLSGQTIEILNTDAEGRLILCDALTYAQQQYKPRYILDVATLTGACMVALGQMMYTGVFSNDDELAEALIAAGQRSRDTGWRLPVDAEYGESLRSNFADFANAGAREGGASVAAQFLSRFIEDTPWAHLDIAGTAWNQNANKGATGRPVPMLVDFLLNA